MTERELTAPPRARNIRGATFAFRELSRDETEHEWLGDLIECIEFFAACDGSLSELRKRGFAAIIMEVSGVDETRVVDEAARIYRTFENLTIGTASEEEVAHLGKFFEAWAVSVEQTGRTP